MLSVNYIILSQLATCNFFMPRFIENLCDYGDNMDSSGITNAATDADDYLKGIVGFLEDGDVDALFWCNGADGNSANFDSEVLEIHASF